MNFRQSSRPTTFVLISRSAFWPGRGPACGPSMGGIGKPFMPDLGMPAGWPAARKLWSRPQMSTAVAAAAKRRMWPGARLGCSGHHRFRPGQGDLGSKHPQSRGRRGAFWPAKEPRAAAGSMLSEGVDAFVESDRQTPCCPSVID